MARFLYVFPHPDDECFGPAPALAKQVREGHEVSLLTFTKGEATKQRDRLGLSKEEMAEVRHDEMRCVAEVLGLADLTVLDFPDGELDRLDPLALEEVVEEHVGRVQPHVVVTYAVHGISGHADHLVTHAVVKHAWARLRQRGDLPFLQRLAFFTLPEESEAPRPEHLQGSPADRLAARIRFTDADDARARRALACYETYKEVIEKHRPLDTVAEGVYFEFFQERYDELVRDLLTDLPVLTHGDVEAVRGG